jgi:hypothetical protein
MDEILEDTDPFQSVFTRLIQAPVVLIFCPFTCLHAGLLGTGIACARGPVQQSLALLHSLCHTGPRQMLYCISSVLLIHFYPARPAKKKRVPCLHTAHLHAEGHQLVNSAVIILPYRAKMKLGLVGQSGVAL